MCKQFVFDERGHVVKRGGKPIKRNGNPPCRLCPKKSPEEAHQYELSPRNLRLLDYFLKHQAAGGMPMDEATKDRFAIIDTMLKKADQASLVKLLVAEIVPFLTKR